MLPFCRLHSRYPLSHNSGLSRTEILVLLALLAILMLAASGPLSSYLRSSRINRAVTSAATLNTLLSQYATDNNGVYPVGEGTPAEGKSEGIARLLLENNYTPDSSVFSVGATPKYKGANPADIGAANISWDFTAGATATTGLTSGAPELLPILYGTGESVTYPTVQGTGLDLALSGQGPFAKSGIVVAYKNSTAVFIPATSSGSTSICRGFISKEFTDTATYTQIRP
jgi:type II secretory pathway pseudopilin PulG